MGPWSFPGCKKLALYCFEVGRGEGGGGGGRVKGVFLILLWKFTGRTAIRNYQKNYEKIHELKSYVFLESQ